MREKDLSDFRLEIDVLDQELVSLLARRLNIVREVARYKHKNHIPAILPDRIDEVVSNVISMGEPLNLPPEYLKDLWTRIIDEACFLEQSFFDQN